MISDEFGKWIFPFIMKHIHVGTMSARECRMQGNVVPVTAGEIAGELATLLYAERRRVARLRTVAGEMSEREVSRLLACHQKEAERHAARLERAFGFLKLDPFTRVCAELDRIYAEGETVCARLTGEARDEMQLEVTRRLQGYRATAYRRALVLAQQAGLDRVATLLRANFQEETAAGIELERYASVFAS
jgi:ferritin-like metal-binding protein YciE